MVRRSDVRELPRPGTSLGIASEWVDRCQAISSAGALSEAKFTYIHRRSPPPPSEPEACAEDAYLHPGPVQGEATGDPDLHRGGLAGSQDPDASSSGRTTRGSAARTSVPLQPWERCPRTPGRRVPEILNSRGLSPWKAVGLKVIPEGWAERLQGPPARLSSRGDSIGLTSTWTRRSLSSTASTTGRWTRKPIVPRDAGSGGADLERHQPIPARRRTAAARAGVQPGSLYSVAGGSPTRRRQRRKVDAPSHPGRELDLFPLSSSRRLHRPISRCDTVTPQDGLAQLAALGAYVRAPTPSRGATWPVFFSKTARRARVPNRRRFTRGGIPGISYSSIT